jgi:mono/diheme cytochrome c family protein
MRFYFFVVLISIFCVSSVKAQTADSAAGKVKFDSLCAPCHGPQGLGDGVAAAALNPQPRNLQTTTKTNAELTQTIKNGGASVGLSPTMPAWGSMLSDADIAHVIAYVRTLKK